MKALIGHTLKQAKEIAKQELGVKRMGEARFKMLLDEGVKKGDFIIEGSNIVPPYEELEDFFNLGGQETETEVEQETEVEPLIKAKSSHPEEAHLDPSLSSSDLPRKGDLYHYRSYTGEVVQGEVISSLCFAECQNPNGTWQVVAFQDLYLKKKSVPREGMSNVLSAYYQNNNKLRGETSRLRSEYESLNSKIEELKKVLSDLEKVTIKN